MIEVAPTPPSASVAPTPPRPTTNLTNIMKKKETPYGKSNVNSNVSDYMLLKFEIFIILLTLVAN